MDLWRVPGVGSRFSCRDPLRWQNLVFRRSKRRGGVAPLHSRLGAVGSAQIARAVSDDDGCPGGVDRCNSDMVRRSTVSGIDRSCRGGVAHWTLDWPGLRSRVLHGAKRALSGCGRSEIRKGLDDSPHLISPCGDEPADDRRPRRPNTRRELRHRGATRGSSSDRSRKELPGVARPPCDGVDGARESQPFPSLLID